MRIITVDPGPTCEILSVDPPQPVEFTPIAIKVEVINAARAPFSGRVGYDGKWSDRPGFAAVSLPAGTGLAGVRAGLPQPTTLVTLYGLAPAAGQNVEIKVGLSPDSGIDEFPPTLVDVTFALNVVANYRFQINTLHCINPRATLTDTLKGSCKVSFGGQPLPSCHPKSPLDGPQEIQYQDYGDHGGGAVIPTDFCFEGFGGVPGIAPELSIIYDFVNSGYAGSPEDETRQILDTVSDLGAGVATALVGGGSGWDIVNQAHHTVNAAITADCDGPVAGDVITASSAVLAQVTGQTGIYGETRRYTGTSSPAICGVVSHYEVTFTFTRLSWPGIVGPPPNTRA